MTHNKTGPKLRNIFRRFLVDFFTSGLTNIDDVELIRKVNMLNSIGIISIAALLPLGLDAIRLGNIVVGLADLILASILASGILYLRRGKNFNFITNLSLSGAALLFFLLLVLKWEEGAGYLWYLIFPLLSSFLKGSRKGFIVSILLISFTAAVFVFGKYLGIEFDRSGSFQVRFIASYLVISILAYSFEKTREKTQSRVVEQNKKLSTRLDELNKLKDKIKDSNKLLEERIKERTGELIEANRILDSEIKEKEVLLKEIHHRVKNNLQVISSLLYLQAGEIDDEKTARYFLDSRNRVLSMAMVHEVLYQSGNLASVNLSNYVKSLVSELLFSYSKPDLEINMDLKIEKILLSIDKAIPIGLIINELVSNAMKYAFTAGEGEISIHISKKRGGRVTIIIADNGKGLQTGSGFESTNTLGFSLVKSLVGQIDGSISLQDAPGTKFEIKFNV